MKTFRVIGLAIVVILLCLSACSDGSDDQISPSPNPEEINSEITIDSNIITNGLNFSSEKGEQSISFFTNENWTLSVAATTSGVTWCTASATSGTKGNTTVKFYVTENTDYDNRSVSVTIKSGTASKTFTISQKCADALLITMDKYEIGRDGGTIDIEVKTNISYEMEISEDAKEWIIESSSRGLTSCKHTLNIAINEESEKREGEVYFKSGDKVETVKIYQVGGSILLLSESEYQVSDKGDTISVDIISNIDFGIQMPDVDWIVDEASSRGLSSHTLKYIVSANEEYDSRTAEIVFYDKNGDLKDTLKVVQVQKDAIVVSQKTYNVKAEGEIIEVKLSANVDFEVKMPEVDWISQTESRALKKHALYFKIAENTGDDKREAEIVFTKKDSQLNESIIIKQTCPKKASYVDGVLTIVTAGTMKKFLGDDYLKITSLKIVGPINGDDVYHLRKMLGCSLFSETDRGKLTNLDLSEASIVEGGEWYYEYYSSAYYSSNDVIGEYMFYKCAGLQNILLPTNITSIGNYAFMNCTSLRSINLPDLVGSIGNCAFRVCI